jgi:glutaredoxin-like protein
MVEKLISESDKAELKKEFDFFKNDVDVKIIKGPEENEFTAFTINFVSELAEISDKIKIEVLDSDHNIAKKEEITFFPHIFIGYDRGYHIEFMGAPIGYEARSLIEAIKTVSTKKTELLDDNLRAKIKEVKKPTKIHVFVTPTCPYCPNSVILSHTLAYENKNIRAICVEASENSELSQRFNVSSVPQQVINESFDHITIGAQPPAKFVAEILKI